MGPLPLHLVVSGSQRELAGRLGLEQSVVSRSMREQRVLPVRALARLIKDGALTPDEVVGVVLWMDEVDQALAVKVGRRQAPTPGVQGAVSPMGEP